MTEWHISILRYIQVDFPCDKFYKWIPLFPSKLRYFSLSPTLENYYNSSLAISPWTRKTLCQRFRNLRSQDRKTKRLLTASSMVSSQGAHPPNNGNIYWYCSNIRLCSSAYIMSFPALKLSMAPPGQPVPHSDSSSCTELFVEQKSACLWFLTLVCSALQKKKNKLQSFFHMTAFQTFADSYHFPFKFCIL